MEYLMYIKWTFEMRFDEDWGCYCMCYEYTWKAAKMEMRNKLISPKAYGIVTASKFLEIASKSVEYEPFTMKVGDGKSTWDIDEMQK